MNKPQRILAKAHFVVALVPWAVLAFFTLYAFLMRRALGHWPVFRENTPDGFLQWFSRGADYAAMGLVFSIPVWLCVLGLRFGVKGAQRRTVWRAALVFALGWFACMGMCAADPVHFFDWFLD